MCTLNYYIYIVWTTLSNCANTTQSNAVKFYCVNDVDNAKHNSSFEFIKICCAV
jgi:hypothetical protein